MPLKHQPMRLTKASMTVIANNFGLLCYKCHTTEEMSRLISSEEYLKYEGPFVQLPTELVEDLTEELKHVTYLRRHHLHMLLGPLVTAWSSHGVGDLLPAFRLLTARCKNLKKLILSHLGHLNPTVFVSLAPTFKNLVCLDLRMTLTVDHVLGEIGSMCNNLLDLNLVSTPITDRGLVQLCVASDGRRLCQKLARLAINETFVTSAGATVAVQSLPNLRDFDFENIFAVLEHVSVWDHALEARLLSGMGVRLNAEVTPPPTSLPLATLVSSVDHVRREGLEAASRLCTEVRAVTLSNAWLASDALYNFMTMDHLVSLSLTNCDGLTLDFHEGVIPLLSVCGKRLENLILSNFTTVDVTIIGRACLQLQNLAISNCATYEYSGQPSPELFNHLQALELWCDPENDLQINMIRQLLFFSETIKNVLFKGCEVVSDNLLADIWNVNPMKKLSHLTLDHCHSLSCKIVHQLLDSDNELVVLRIWSCLNITKYHSCELARRISEENMDVYFEWFQYDE